MIKIIERKEYKILRFHFSCNHCRSVLECTEEDFDFPMSLGRATVCCPVCNRRTSVTVTDAIIERD